MRVTICDVCHRGASDDPFKCECGAPWFDSGTKEYWQALRESFDRDAHRMMEADPDIQVSGDELYDHYIEVLEQQNRAFGPDLVDHPMFDHMMRGGSEY